MAQTSSRSRTLPVEDQQTGWVRHCRKDTGNDPFLTILQRATINTDQIPRHLPHELTDEISGPVVPVVDRRRDPDAPINLTYAVDHSLKDRLGALKSRKVGDYLLLPTDMTTESLVLCEETEFGPCYTGDYFYTACYPDPEGLQTTLAFWTRDTDRPIEQGE